MAAKFKTKCGQHLVDKVVAAAGTEAWYSAALRNGSKNRLVDRRRDRPAPLVGIRNIAGKILRVATLARPKRRRQVRVANVCFPA